MNTKIDLAYDSHVHFFGVGIPAVQWRISDTATKLNLPDHLKNQKLIKGFGWSNKLPLSEFTKLTQKYPNKLFCLSYFDGHSSFISKNMIEKIKLSGKNHKELKTGIIVGEVERDRLLKTIPTDSSLELRKMALFAQDVFLENEVNRVRHLTAREDHWHCLKKLESENLLKIKVEFFFSEFMGQSLQEAINTFNKLKNNNSHKLTASGVKIFYDGAFGSNTAYTSCIKTCPPRCDKNQLEKKMVEIFSKTHSPLAIHTIGDQALSDAIDIYARLNKSQNLPTLHLEHAPIFSEKTLKTLKEKKLNCVFHFQPSHWIHDHKWYAEHKEDLQKHSIYPFKFLFKHGYEFHFGSDAPVVNCSKDNMVAGLQLIEEYRES